MRLLSNTGDPIENCVLFVHIAITNKRGGGVSKHMCPFAFQQCEVIPCL